MTIEWKPATRVDLRAIDRKTALRILHAITRYANTGEGDVRRLKGAKSELRLRVSGWRGRIGPASGGGIRILPILARSQAYR